MKPYWKITTAYLAFGVLWIYFSDRIAHTLSLDTHSLTYLQTIKGWVFIALSGYLVYFFSKRSCNNLLRQEEDKLIVFKKAIEGAQHILLNYLNQMQLVTLEAENSKDFDSKTLAIAKEATDKASKDLILLMKINDSSPEKIHSIIYRELKTSELIQAHSRSSSQLH